MAASVYRFAIRGNYSRYTRTHSGVFPVIVEKVNLINKLFFLELLETALC